MPECYPESTQLAVASESKKNNQEKLCLSVPEAAKLLGISRGLASFWTTASRAFCTQNSDTPDSTRKNAKPVAKLQRFVKVTG